jgi:hypothetical protein
MRVTVKNKDLVVDDRAITFGAESIGFAEIDSVQYRENSGGVYAGRALVIAVGMVLGVVVVERGSSCPTLTFAGRGRKITVAMPLSGKKRANSVEAYALLADALSEDILPNAATAITCEQHQEGTDEGDKQEDNSDRVWACRCDNHRLRRAPEVRLNLGVYGSQPAAPRRQPRAALLPPSTWMVVPVIHWLASLARNTAAAAQSLG